IIRDADDCVCAFQYEDDARRFESELAPRLAKFGLEVAREKTRTLRFSRFGGQENGTFCFLGYEYRWVERRSGKPGVQRRTAPRKKQASIANFTEWFTVLDNILDSNHILRPSHRFLTSSKIS
ncbi:MAG: hypothetical protein WCZ10_11610, partial [Desulfobulbaceae bacterium]